MVSSELQLVDFMEYEQFWEDYRQKMMAHGFLTSSFTNAIFKQTIKNFYGWDIDVIPYDRRCRVYMKPDDYTWFILKWSK